MSVVKIPNLVLPLPGFLVVALMDAYTIDATTLCLAAIAAINARAEPAGEDPSSSLLANRASYVAAWLWNLATKRTRAQGLGVVAGAHVSLAMKPRADAWARDVHLTKYYLTSQPSNTTVVRTRTGGNNDLCGWSQSNASNDAWEDTACRAASRGASALVKILLGGECKICLSSSSQPWWGVGLSIKWAGCGEPTR
ncbi:hypothetical protein MHU86_16862 [Fragilaria crotonensis]|nr:hypothetical protein MHU86_16862 [Fragilaria crotonensis]